MKICVDVCISLQWKIKHGHFFRLTSSPRVHDCLFLIPPRRGWRVESFVQRLIDVDGRIFSILSLHTKSVDAQLIKIIANVDGFASLPVETSIGMFCAPASRQIVHCSTRSNKDFSRIDSIEDSWMKMKEKRISLALFGENFDSLRSVR